MLALGFNATAGNRLPRLLTWALVLAIAASLAWWTWRLIPLPSATGGRDAASPAVSADPSRLRSQHWFSAAAASGPAASGRYILRWVYPGRPGVCILGLPGLQDRAFRVGEEVEPGLAVQEVGADHVVLAGAAGIERIALPAEAERHRHAAATAAPAPAREIRSPPPNAVSRDH